MFDRQNSIENNFNFDSENMNVDIDMNNYQEYNNQNMNIGSVQSAPIVEPMQEREVHRTIVHDVPHICPIRTKIINHHIFRHSYSPSYSCCEENTCSNVQCGSCSGM